MKYDYLIVGCGMYGATIARRCLDLKKTVIIIDKRNHIAGNAYTENRYGIDIHRYGAHIFHTSSEKIWNFVNSFSKFNSYKHKVIANNGGKLFSLPFNMWTFHQFWGISSPKDAMEAIEKQKFIGKPSNLEEQAMSMVGEDIYYSLIKHYTSKQWKQDPKNLPASIIKRIPIRFIYDDNYFDDTYQGIPIDGYTNMVSKMIEGATIVLDTNFFDKRAYWESIAENIVYTGPIDKFFDYNFGTLSYRSLFFEQLNLNQQDFQGTSVVNYTDPFTPYTRIIEHKHFTPERKEIDQTVITKEYPVDYDSNNEPYYPINNDINTEVYNKYKKLTKLLTKRHIFGGRLAEYRYYDMHQVIGSALSVEI
jgi:UDP-galactopyranose mutase